MAYWDSWLTRDTAFPLPKDLQKIIPTEEEVALFLEKGGDPLEISIQKWRAIEEVFQKLCEQQQLPLSYVNALKPLIGQKNCGLCIAAKKKFFEEHEKMEFSSDKCNYCPLLEIEGCLQPGSTYQKIEKLVSSSFVDISKLKESEYIRDLASLIKKMVTNVTALERSGYGNQS